MPPSRVEAMYSPTILRGGAQSAGRRRRAMTRAALIALLALVLAAVGIDWTTWPPVIPAYAHVRADWRPSEAWLYDRHGTLIDSARVDFAARRLAWVPLDYVAPIVPATVHRRRGCALPAPRRDRLAGDCGVGARAYRRRAATRREHAVDAGRRVPLARSRRAGRPRVARETAPDARRPRAGGGVEQGPDPRGVSEPRAVSAANRRGSVPRRWRCSARRQPRSPATMRCCSRPCSPIRRRMRPASRRVRAACPPMPIARGSRARPPRCSDPHGRSRSIRVSRRISPTVC